MLRRTLLALCAFASVPFVACSGGDDSAESPSATLDATPVTAESTTTTEPELTVEQEVEAAYLRSWDVYAEAVRVLDESLLAEAFADRGLEIVIADVAKLRAAGQYGLMNVDHDIAVEVNGDTATVVDRYVNHSVAVDAESDQPVEPDPNELLEYTYTLRLIEGTWKVIGITSED